jgi:alpha-D-ribose 1-methylphosphonate 5-triphosphate synthase subunit PhnG
MAAQRSACGRSRPPHAERCAAIDALLQSPRHFHNLMETLITPLEALQGKEVDPAGVDFGASGFNARAA